MKIAVLGAYPPSLINFRGPLITAMIACGHQVVGLAAEEHAATRAALARLGADYQVAALARTGLNPFQDAASIVALARRLRALSPDMLLAYTAKPVIYGALAARLAGVRRVFLLIEGLGYAFSRDHHGLRRRLVRLAAGRLYRWALSGSSAVFFLNPDDKQEFLESEIVASDQALHVVPGTGIDLDHFGHAPARPTDAPSFLMIARLLRDKGVADFVAAARRLRSRHPAARFRLLGPRDRHPSAVSDAELRGWQAEGAIEYLGETDDVRPYLRACDVFVLPSYYREGLPRTALEAMATGRAVVTSDRPGCRETVVEGDNGFLVPARDPAALAAALERFLLDPELAPRLGRRGRELAEQRFDVRLVNATMLAAMGLR